MISIMLIDVVPTGLRLQERLRETVSPLIYWAGIGQGVWNLFAPDPANQTNYISVSFSFDDGSKFLWISPQWQNVSALGKFIANREINFYAFIGDKSSAAAWPNFINYLACHEVPQKEGKSLTSVTMVQHSHKIAPPDPALRRHIIPQVVEFETSESLLHLDKDLDFSC